MPLSISAEGKFTKISVSKLSAYLTSHYLNVIKFYKLKSDEFLLHVTFFFLTEDIISFNDMVVQEQGIY